MPSDRSQGHLISEKKYHLIYEKLPLGGFEVLWEEQLDENDPGAVHRKVICALFVTDWADCVWHGHTGS
jgi:hypothetical protein